LASLLSTFGVSSTVDDTSAIETFLKSRDALQQLGERANLREIYGRADADFLSRYPRFWEDDTFERLYARLDGSLFPGFISVVQDEATGITTLEVQAFRPDDAKLITTTLVTLAEEMANKMNERAEADTVGESKKEVARSQQDVLQAQADLTTFRNKEFLISPTTFADALLGLISQLALDRAQTQTSINQTLAMSPANPSLPALRASVESLGKRIDDERKKLASDEAALSDKVGIYEGLTLLRDVANKEYSSALLSLQAAEQNAERKKIYVEEVVSPNLPDSDIEPQRFRYILTMFVMSFALFSVFWILSVGAKDHAQ
jgi:capsular polysaccharide transport system permease protein